MEVLVILLLFTVGIWLGTGIRNRSYVYFLQVVFHIIDVSIRICDRYVYASICTDYPVRIRKSNIYLIYVTPHYRAQSRLCISNIVALSHALATDTYIELLKISLLQASAEKSENLTRIEYYYITCSA